MDPECRGSNVVATAVENRSAVCPFCGHHVRVVGDTMVTHWWGKARIRARVGVR